MTILVLTVGGSHQPLVTAIQSLKPECVVFLCSDDAPGTKGSYVQVMGEGLVIKSNPKLEKPDLPNIVVQANLASKQYEIVKIRHFDNLETCYLEARNVLERLHRDCPEARIIADYTGGTKTMTAGLAVAAVDFEWCALNVVAGTRADLEKVTEGTQFAKPLRVWNLRGKRKLREVQVRLKCFDYAGAASLLEAIAGMPISQPFSENIAAGLAICRGLDTWDRFDHKGARNLIQPYRRHLVAECVMLDQLCQAKPRDPYIRAEDLLLNAERRAAQGRYDDAVARVYRALELIAQIRLKEHHETDTADVNPETQPEHAKEWLARYRSHNGKIQLPLFAAWSLLEARGDSALGSWFAKHKSRVKQFLGTRNFSILAHGDQPIGQTQWEADGATGLLLCREALNNIPKSERGAASIQQLPQALTVLELETE